MSIQKKEKKTNSTISLQLTPNFVFIYFDFNTLLKDNTIFVTDIIFTVHEQPVCAFFISYFNRNRYLNNSE